MEVLGEKQLRIYNYINPAKDRNFEILEDLTFHKLGIRDVGRQIIEKPAMSGTEISAEDLKNFPKFSKNIHKIVINYSDQIIEAKDLLDFQLLNENENKNMMMELPDE